MQEKLNRVETQAALFMREILQINLKLINLSTRLKLNEN